VSLPTDGVCLPLWARRGKIWGRRTSTLGEGDNAMTETTTAVDATLIQEIVRRVLTVMRPEKIILFGSAAAGRMTRDSDIDLLIVLREPGDRLAASVQVDAALDGLGYAFDVIVISTKWFEESKHVIGGIAYPAHKYGKVIYEAA